VFHTAGNRGQGRPALIQTLLMRARQVMDDRLIRTKNACVGAGLALPGERPPKLAASPTGRWLIVRGRCVRNVL
jgi:hypothetical protein